MNNQIPGFNPNFKYNNIGLIVGSVVFAKELLKQDGDQYGIEFLISSKGHGSINVRIPMLQKAQNSLDNYPVSDKPRVRVGLVQLEQFTTDKGKTYTNGTSFVELQEPTSAAGDDMPDQIKGRLGGEVFNLRSENGVIKFSLVTYSTDRDDKTKRAMSRNGEPIQPQVLALEVHDENVQTQFAQIQNGMNIEVGYTYVNKNNTSYDEFGFEIQGESVDRIEVGKVIVHGNMQGTQANGFANHGGQPQQQYQTGFAQSQPSQGSPQEYFGGVDTNIQTPFDNNPQQQAQQYFSQPQGQQQGQSFGFGN